MCSSHSKTGKFFSIQKLILLSVLLGIVSGYFPFPGQEAVASAITSGFVNLFKLVSMPIIFLSLLCTLCGMKELSELKWMGSKVVSYTFLTTFIAALVALGMFLWIDPVKATTHLAVGDGAVTEQGSYMTYLSKIIPSNFFQPFMEGNVIGVLLLAVLLGLGLLFVPGREKVHAVLSPVLQGLMKIVSFICYAIPLLVWAGIVLSFDQLRDGEIFGHLFLYLVVVVGATLLQGIVVLPLLLKAHRIPPMKAFYGLLPALTMAFFSKSSVATLPLAMRCAEERLKMAPQVSQFTFPLCTTINMNGCAAFILTTVLFVTMGQGVQYAFWELFVWVGIATLAAVGNAGVPMGCYFLATAILATMGMSLDWMALILPFYSLIDMVETAVNVWSDGCVALVVNQQYQRNTANALAQVT